MRDGVVAFRQSLRAADARGHRRRAGPRPLIALRTIILRHRVRGPASPAAPARPNEEAHLALYTLAGAHPVTLACE